MVRIPRWRPIYSELITFYRFVLYVARQFFGDRCTLVAGALTLMTLFALVPVVAFVVTVFATFPAFQSMGRAVQALVVRNFVPAAGAVVQEYMIRFVEQTSRLQLLGLLFFIVTAGFLIATIDRTLNDVWKVKARRPAVRAFLLYWAVLTLGPLLLGLSVGLTSYFVSFPIVSGTVAQLGLQQPFYTIIPFFLTTAGLTFLYITVPNARVRFFHAVVGGLVAASLFELAKRWFAVYVTNMPSYKLVFGAMAAVPLFLLWIYLSWVVVLLGAELVHALSVFRFHRPGVLKDKFVISYRLLGHLWRVQLEGGDLGEEDLLRLEPSVSDTNIRDVLTALEKVRLLGRLLNGRYQLSRNLGDVSLHQLYRMLPWRLPDPDRSLPPSPDTGRPAGPDQETRFRLTLKESARALEQSLHVPLDQLYRKEGYRSVSLRPVQSGSELAGK